MTENVSDPRSGCLISRLFIAVVDLYALFVVGFVLVKLLTGYTLYVVSFLSTFTHLLLLPAFVLLPLMVVVRRYWVAGILAGAVVLFVWLFGGLLLPKQQAAEESALTVMTVNAGVAYDSPPEQLARVIDESEADVIVIQELSDVQQAIIERDLIGAYPYQVLYGTPSPDVMGKGLLSRYPLLEASEPFRLREWGNLHLYAQVDVSGRTVTVVNAHPPPPLWLRWSLTGPFDLQSGVAGELAGLIDRAMAGGPGLLLGDFNTTDQNERYTLLAAAGLSDAFRVAGQGLGPTWPAWLPAPLLRLDHVWYTGHFRALDAWVGPPVGGDHLPVLARLAWQE